MAFTPVKINKMMVFSFIFSLFFSTFQPAMIGSSFIVHRSSFEKHDFKMSVCEMIYQPAQRRFEIKFYLFRDDLNQALHGVPSLDPVAGLAARAYILNHFEMTANSQPQALSFQSIREKGEQVLVQFLTPALTKSLSEIEIKNNLLTEQFRSQVNMLYLYYPDEKSKHTKILDAKKTKEKFTL